MVTREMKIKEERDAVRRGEADFHGGVGEAFDKRLAEDKRRRRK